MVGGGEGRGGGVAVLRDEIKSEGVDWLMGCEAMFFGGRESEAACRRGMELHVS